MSKSNQNQQKNNPIQKIKKNVQEESDYGFNLEDFEKYDKNYNLINYDTNNAFVPKYSVSEVGFIPGSIKAKNDKKDKKTEEYIQNVEFNKKLQHSFKSKGRQYYSKLKENTQTPSIGYYKQVDDDIFSKKSPAFSFKKSVSTKDLGQATQLCNEDFYDINENLLRLKETKTYVADLERSNLDRYNIQKKVIVRQKPKEINMQELDEQIENLQNQIKKEKFQVPANYILQHSLKRRPSINSMVAEWYNKELEYNVKLGKKGFNKLYSQDKQVMFSQKNKNQKNDKKNKN